MTTGSNVSIINSNFISNTAHYAGGAIQLERDNNYVSNCLFEDNVAYHVGAGVAWVGDNGLIVNSIFTNTLSNMDKASQYGGAIAWMGDNGVVGRSSFYYNCAKKYGAAVYWRGDNGSVNNCIFENNTSSNDQAYWGNPTYANTNYWGYNISSNEQFIDNKLIYYNGSFKSPQNWVNIEYNPYLISFKTNTGDELNEYMPDYTLTSGIVISNNHYKFKKESIIECSDISLVSGKSKYLKITLKNQSNKNLQITLNGKIYNLKTDSNGVVNFLVNIKKPGKYLVNVLFNEDDDYNASNVNVNVVVRKATPKLIASKKTYKQNLKIKKYTITLKDNNGKVMKKTKVTLKIKGKTFKATTNAKGRATFKITKLTKKGTFTSIVKFKGNNYYNSVTKSIKIIVST